MNRGRFTYEKSTLYFFHTIALCALHNMVEQGTDLDGNPLPINENIQKLSNLGLGNQTGSPEPVQINTPGADAGPVGQAPSDPVAHAAPAGQMVLAGGWYKNYSTLVSVYFLPLLFLYWFFNGNLAEGCPFYV